MKNLRLIGSFLFALVMVASAVFPADVQAMVPVSLHDFMFSADPIVCGAAGAVFTGISRKVRGVANIGGITKMVLFADTDLTTDWPLQKDITAGVLSTPPPVAAGVVGAVLTFDTNTGRAKSARKGDLGYQTVDVDGEGKFAGYEAAQIDALDKTLNSGGVAIIYYKNGDRSVYGTKLEPLTFEDASDTGAKGDDKLQLDFKFKGSGYAFHPPLLGPTVVVPLPA
ncbi:hypothetical protein FAES_2287 [Fibrella aestuarina BUZ 2]|uniref:Uncharacterized protein n=1 Tax=Fibrella aestuarina BUZ 2 TaxID=1166018 RepID=I0K843_9BACT|nr:hypothetical protein [Fibrella aestuarina]CCH00296.1 hypothetical protein FAES_2287 [Fibrella aestuarina BUZ 2]